MFSELLTDLNNKLSDSAKYTFTYRWSAWYPLNLPGLDSKLRSYNLPLSFISVTKKLFGTDIAITIIPKYDTTTAQYWLDLFRQSFISAGYDSVLGKFDFIALESGSESTVAAQSLPEIITGTVTGAAKDIGRGVGETAWEILKPLMPIFIGAGILLVVLAKSPAVTKLVEKRL